jgi:protein-tyrosine phosphatase
MIDIHTHILPGLDDGAPDWEQAIAMARAAAAEGITTIVATPHHANGVYHNEADVVKEAVARFNERMNTEGIPLTVVPGQEIRIHDDLLDAWGRGESHRLFRRVPCGPPRLPHARSVSKSRPDARE